MSFLGPEGSHSHEAALSLIPRPDPLVACRTFAQVLDAVDDRTTAQAILPLDNTTTGLIDSVLRLLLTRPVPPVVATLRRPIAHHLLGCGGSDLRAIDTVISHPEVLRQCRDWLRQTLPAANLVPAASSAVAAEKAMNDPRTAAIATTAVASRLGLVVLADDIQDDPHNATRFVVCGGTAPDGGEPRATLLLASGEAAAQTEARIDSGQLISRVRGAIDGVPWVLLDLTGSPGTVAQQSRGGRILGSYAVNRQGGGTL